MCHSNKADPCLRNMMSLPIRMLKSMAALAPRRSHDLSMPR